MYQKIDSRFTLFHARVHGFVRTSPKWLRERGRIIFICVRQLNIFLVLLMSLADDSKLLGNGGLRRNGYTDNQETDRQHECGEGL